MKLRARRIPAFVGGHVVSMDDRSWILRLGVFQMSANSLNTEAELRNAVIDRMIAASLSDGKPAREANLEQWRSLGTKSSKTTSTGAAGA